MNIISILLLVIYIYFQDSLVGLFRTNSSKSITFNVIIYLVIAIIYYTIKNICYTCIIVKESIKVIFKLIKSFTKIIVSIIELIFKFMIIYILINFSVENKINFSCKLNNNTILSI
jgi:hypothetical protein